MCEKDAAKCHTNVLHADQRFISLAVFEVTADAKTCRVLREGVTGRSLRCCSLFVMMLHIVFQKGRHQLMAITRLILNRKSLFSLADSLVIFLKIPPHLIHIAALLCQTAISENKQESQTIVAINEKLQGSVATYFWKSIKASQTYGPEFGVCLSGRQCTRVRRVCVCVCVCYLQRATRTARAPARTSTAPWVATNADPTFTLLLAILLKELALVRAASRYRYDLIIDVQECWITFSFTYLTFFFVIFPAFFIIKTLLQVWLRIVF